MAAGIVPRRATIAARLRSQALPCHLPSPHRVHMRWCGTPAVFLPPADLSYRVSMRSPLNNDMEATALACAWYGVGVKLVTPLVPFKPDQIRDRVTPAARLTLSHVAGLGQDKVQGHRMEAATELMWLATAAGRSSWRKRATNDKLLEESLDPTPETSPTADPPPLHTSADQSRSPRSRPPSSRHPALWRSRIQTRALGSGNQPRPNPSRRFLDVTSSMEEREFSHARHTLPTSTDVPDVLYVLYVRIVYPGHHDDDGTPGWSISWRLSRGRANFVQSNEMPSRRWSHGATSSDHRGEHSNHAKTEGL